MNVNNNLSLSSLKNYSVQKTNAKSASIKAENVNGSTNKNDADVFELNITDEELIDIYENREGGMLYLPSWMGRIIEKVKSMFSKHPMNQDFSFLGATVLDNAGTKIQLGKISMGADSGFGFSVRFSF